MTGVSLFLLILQYGPQPVSPQMEFPNHISATQAAPTDGIPMPRRLGAILAVAFGVSLSVLDGSIANVALPTIGRELGISPADSIWIVNAYQLAIMISILSLSALGDTWSATARSTSAD